MKFKPNFTGNTIGKKAWTSPCSCELERSRWEDRIWKYRIQIHRVIQTLKIITTTKLYLGLWNDIFLTYQYQQSNLLLKTLFSGLSGFCLSGFGLTVIDLTGLGLSGFGLSGFGLLGLCLIGLGLIRLGLIGLDLSGLGLIGLGRLGSLPAWVQ